MFKFILPGWLASLIVAVAAYLRGRDDQAKADAAAGQAQDACEDQVVRQKQAEAEALDHDQLQKQEGKWNAP